MWAKKGLIYVPNGSCEWSKNYAQVPTVLKIDDSRLRIFFSSRDANNRSNIGFLDVSATDPAKILNVCDHPVLTCGKPGAFDDCGVMPSSIVQLGNSIFMYYTGWNVRNTIPYHNSIGLAVSYDNGLTFSRMFHGPIMDRIATEPFFCGSCYVLKESTIWRMWYLSCTDWIDCGDRSEPRYHLKYAESADGVNWIRQGIIALDFKDDYEGGIAQPSVRQDDDGYKMWFCYRNLFDYRYNPENSYKIGAAISIDGVNWQRLTHIEISPGDDGSWDSIMQAYPDVVSVRGKTYMFYNGNGFGQTGIGYAEWI